LIAVITLFSRLVKSITTNLNEAVHSAAIGIVLIGIIALFTNSLCDESISTHGNGTKLCTGFRGFSLIAFFQTRVDFPVSTNGFGLFFTPC